ncbi:MAG: autotransporter-associated beta strand repeat-containing protein [Verrucomicrobiaceae bacterium]|nr:autotransporter-associated beta strand repeat-containing protein [Verrucomicrobiaceae bacterium]
MADCLLMLGLCQVATLRGQSIWDGAGADNNWTTGANWGGTAPVAGASLQFGGTTRLTNTNAFVADTLFNGITFNSGAGSFVLGGNRITLGGNVVNNDDSDQTFNLNLMLNGTRTFSSVNPGTGIVINGVISETGGSQGIVVNMNGALTLNNANTFTGGVNIQKGNIYAYSAGALNSTTPNALTFTNTGGDSAGLTIFGVGVEVSGLSGASSSTLITSGYLGGSPTGSLTVRNTTDSTFAGRFRNGASGAGNLDLFKAGSGTLTLTNTLSDHAGFTIVYEGTLRNGASNVLSDNSTTVVAASAGKTATLDLNGFDDAVSGLTFGGYGASVVQTGAGTLTLNGNVTFNAAFNSLAASLTGKLALGSSTRTFNIVDSTNATEELTVSAVISGAGGITKDGTGVLKLSGANIHTGATSIAAGTLAINTDGSLGAVPGSASTNLQFTGSGTLRSDATITLNANRNVSIASGATATFDSNGNTLRINGIISGSGSLAAAGAGTVTLAANNTYGGSTNVAAGTTLRLGTGGANGSLGSGSVVNNGEVIFNRTANYTLSNGMSGGGSVTKLAANTLFITGTKSYTGTTTISAGTLSLGNPSVDGGTEVITYVDGALSPSSSIVNNATLRMARQTATQGTHFGAISGTGDVNVNYGAVTLNASNTYSGKTSILPGSGLGNSPSITFNSIANVGGGPSALGAPTTVGNGTIDLGTTNFATSKSVSLIYNGTGHTSDRVLNLSSQTDQVTLSHAGSGLLKFTSNLTATGSGSKNFELNAVTGATGELAGAIPDNSVTNKTSVSKTGTGTWVLSGANTYTGATTVSQGILQIGNGGTSGSLSTSSNTSISSGATLAFNRSDTVLQGTHFENSLSGAGKVRQDGIGTLVLSGTNSYTGSTTATAGTLHFAKQTALYNNTPASWTAANLNVKSGATLAFNVGGTGEFTTGNVTTLLTNLAASTSATNGMNAGSFLGFDTSNAAGGSFTVADVIADTTGASGGARGLTKLGDNTLLLTNGNTYTGAATISGGTLEVSANNALGTNAAGTTVASGATLRLNGVSYTTAEALAINGTGVSGGGALVNAGTSSYAGQITAATNSTINAGGGTLTVTGGLVKNGTTLTIAGGGSVIVNTTGISGASANSDLVVDGTTLVVNANSNYNGPTTVQNSGTLVANATVTTTQVTVTSNSTLSGTGSIDNGAGLVSLGGALVVGDTTLGSPFVSDLEISGTGSTVLGSSSTLSFDIFARGGNLTANAAAADRLRLFGTLDATLGGTFVLGNPAALTGFAAGDEWLLVDLQGGASITGALGLNYTSLNLGPGLTGSFNNSTGVFSITATPEPSRTILLLAGFAISVLGRRRRQLRP